MSNNHLIEITRFIDKEQVELPNKENLGLYNDYLNTINTLPLLLVFPKSTEEVSKILAYCNQHRIGVTFRGAGTSLCASSVVTHPEHIILSTKNLNKIIDIDPANGYAIVQPGVINEDLQKAANQLGMMYPPDPASKESSTIGGNIAHNSGGPKAVKYGTTKDFVLNLEVVLANGTIINTGANTLKNSTGYNLTSLFLCSEGTLGCITQATLKIIPKPKFKILLKAEFSSIAKATESVGLLMQNGLNPSALELMERKAVLLSAEYQNINPNIFDDTVAVLLIEFDGNFENSLYEEAQQVYELLLDSMSGEMAVASQELEMQELWKIRRKIGEAVKQGSGYIEEDTVVPRAKLPQLMSGIKSLEQKYDLETVCYGHAGDGNLHVNILRGDIEKSIFETKSKNFIEELFTLVYHLGGTLSGEHGIGITQKPYLGLVKNQTSVDLMKAIKKAYDPNNILNPGKIWD
jgi:glycolate oxidase